jgi:hypothetical protein
LEIQIAHAKSVHAKHVHVALPVNAIIATVVLAIAKKEGRLKKLF